MSDCLLPTDCPPQLKARLETLCVHFGHLIRDGEVRQCTIPKGWRFRSTDDHRKEELVDGSGNVQAIVIQVTADYSVLREYKETSK